MKKDSIYLDTSIPSAYLDERLAARRALTQNFWAHVLPKYDVYISDVTNTELLQTPNPETQKKLLELVAPFKVLPLGGEAEALAETFIEDGLIDEEKPHDANHLAVAVVEEMTMLVSWNFVDMVSAHTKRLLPMLCAKHGYTHQLIIVSPLEFS